MNWCREGCLDGRCIGSPRVGKVVVLKAVDCLELTDMAFLAFFIFSFGKD